jgi:hypothetical protein
MAMSPPPPSEQSKLLAAVIVRATLVGQGRASLVDAMADAIRGGVSPEEVAVAAIRSELPLWLSGR